MRSGAVRSVRVAMIQDAPVLRTGADFGEGRQALCSGCCGSLARPDNFQLHVDERPIPPVISQQ
jgi:hypothetical protein